MNLLQKKPPYHAFCLRKSTQFCIWICEKVSYRARSESESGEDFLYEEKLKGLQFDKICMQSLKKNLWRKINRVLQWYILQHLTKPSHLLSRYTAWKGSVFGVFLVRIFPHSDWIRGDALYLSVFSPNVGKYEPEKLQIRTLFRQWYPPNHNIC